MVAEKKDKEKFKCSQHNFVITGWMSKGGNQNATQMRCSHCLLHMCLEELNSKEWKESQGM